MNLQDCFPFLTPCLGIGTGFLFHRGWRKFCLLVWLTLLLVKGLLVSFPLFCWGGAVLAIRMGWFPSRGFRWAGGPVGVLSSVTSNEEDLPGESEDDEPDKEEIDKMEAFLWYLILGGAVVVLVAILLYWYFGVTPSNPNELTRGYSNRPVQMVEGNRPQLDRTSTKPNVPVGAVRALATYLVRRRGG